MGSSENMDSSTPPTRSTFSRTCSRLSQYFKENGGFGEIGLGLTSETRGTLNLLPKIDKEREVKGSQMTIFYGGEVIVFNDYPPEKANEVMKLAAGFTASLSVCSAESAASSSALRRATLPITRGQSLSRFLEKRKDRAVAVAPYQVNKPQLKPSNEPEPLLELALPASRIN